jgi:hypothetical protein
MRTVDYPLWSVLAVLAIFTAASWGAEQPFLAAPHSIAPPDAEHAVTNRAFQGIPSMAVAPGGRLWADWYAGITPGEDHNNYVVVSTSGDKGTTWKEVLIIDPDAGGPVRAFDPELWMAPNGRLFVFWAQTVAHDGTTAGVWCVTTSEPAAECPTWSTPRRLTDGVMMCKPLVLSTGEWVLPVSTWAATDHSARMVVSTNQGETWTVRGGCNVPRNVRSFDEHMFIERRDGSLWLLVRTKYGIGESVSIDGGKTWPELKPSSISHTESRFFIRRLNSGSLLLVKHSPRDKSAERSHLTAFISTDDGRTWGGGLLLDERRGVSYPDGQQAADGLIRIIYDFSRVGSRHILMAAFREEDAAAGKPVTDAVRLRQLVSAGSGGRLKPVRTNADGEPFRKTTPGKLRAEGFQAKPLVGGAVLFTDRNYTLAERPEALNGAHFIQVAMDGSKKLLCESAGTVWILTPSPENNSDSQEKALLDQRFAKAALPEVCLFAPKSPGNFCTIYQKDCVAGESLTIGKWAVPVFFR